MLNAATHSQRGMKIFHRNTSRLENSISQTHQKNRTSDSSRRISIPTLYEYDYIKKKKQKEKQETGQSRRVRGWEYYLLNPHYSLKSGNNISYENALFLILKAPPCLCLCSITTSPNLTKIFHFTTILLQMLY